MNFIKSRISNHKTTYFSLFEGMILLAFLLVPVLLFGSTYPPHDSVRIKYFTLEDGLSQVSVNDLLRDKNGFVWIATQDGLNRFDGNRFEQFKYREQDTSSISGNYINALLEDNRGDIWVGAQGNGLCRYDYQNNVFHRFSLTHSSSENEMISGITMDSGHNVWIASRVSGLHKLVYLAHNKSYHQSSSLANYSLSALAISQGGKIWVALKMAVFLVLIQKKNQK